MPLIKCSGVALGYNGSAVAENIDFEINSGDYLCVVGENGSGKSTLMKALLHLHPPIGGSIEYGDGLKQNDIGYLPQQTAVQRDFPASVREVVLSGCLNGKFHPFYNREDKKRAAAAMAQMKIGDLAAQCYRELSGGQQQRVLLARAVCAAKRLLVLDEPVTGLDPQMSAQMYSAIDAFNSENGLAVIMISHDTEAVGHAGYVLHMGHEPLFFGTSSDYAKSEVGRRFLSSGGGVCQ